MTIIAITISAVVCGWSILLVISDERQRALMNAQVMNAQAAAQTAQPEKVDKARNDKVRIANAKPDKPKAADSGKRKN